jgi:CelD/BcsL family acetyltransferase involved in cellulose biosynthesis
MLSPNDPRYSVTALDEHRIPAALAEEIAALAQEAVEANVFYEPWLLDPALESWQPAGLRLVVVRDGAGALTGFFPFYIQRHLRGLVHSLRLWRHLYCFLCTPLVARRAARETLAALADWIESGRAPANMIEMDWVGADGPFAELLDAQILARPRWTTHSALRERALFKPRSKPEVGISADHMKKLRRLERKLGELGPVQYRVLAEGDPASEWIEHFLRLEASGWKGRGGSALASDAASTGYFRRIVDEGARRRRVQLLSLELAGRPIAMKCNFLAGDGAFIFKVAYDEDYAKFSPGLLLELFNSQHVVEACAELAWVDSCANPDSPLFNRLWTDRRRLGHYRLAGRGWLARAFVKKWNR